MNLSPSSTGHLAAPTPLHSAPTPTIADVMDHLSHAKAEVIAGAAGVARASSRVLGVTVIENRQITTLELPAGHLLVLLPCPDGPDRSQHRVDLLLRRAAAAGAVGLLLTQPSPAGPTVATRRLADQAQLPLIQLSGGVAPMQLVLEVQVLVHQPALARAHAVLEAAGSRHRSATPEDVVRRLERAVGGEAAVLSADLVVSGDIPDSAQAWARSKRGQATARRGNLHTATIAFGGRDDQPEAWVCVARHNAGPGWAETALLALTVVLGDLTAWLAEEHVSAERSARDRSTLLAEILEHGESLPPDVRARAAAFDWQVSGWHTGIHLRIEAGSLPGWTLQSALTGAGAPALGLRIGRLVERSDGWACWGTSAQAPSPTVLRRLTRVMRDLALDLTRTRPGLRLAVGIGTPSRDATGIGPTLSQARQAALVAAATGEPVAVRAVHDLGASRLLLGWYGSGAFQDVATQILGPLVEAGEQELLITLEAYLDRACSAAHTARVLGVHRNTVAQRIGRTEKILGMSLSSPDTRLALQLALRARRSHEATPPAATLHPSHG